MSNRTILEINHAFAAKIDADRAELGAAMSQALRPGTNEHAWLALRGFGITRIITLEDADKRTIYVNGRAVEEGK